MQRPAATGEPLSWDSVYSCSLSPFHFLSIVSLFSFYRSGPAERRSPFPSSPWAGTACPAWSNLHGTRTPNDYYLSFTLECLRRPQPAVTREVTDRLGAGVTVSIAPIQLDVDVGFEHCVAGSTISTIGASRGGIEHGKSSRPLDQHRTGEFFSTTRGSLLSAQRRNNPSYPVFTDGDGNKREKRKREKERERRT